MSSFSVETGGRLGLTANALLGTLALYTAARARPQDFTYEDPETVIDLTPPTDPSTPSVVPPALKGKAKEVYVHTLFNGRVAISVALQEGLSQRFFQQLDEQLCSVYDNMRRGHPGVRFGTHTNPRGLYCFPSYPPVSSVSPAPAHVSLPIPS